VSAEDDLRSFIAGVLEFEDMGHTDKVRLFSWLQHHLFKKDRFKTADINWCYDKLYLDPSNTSQYLKILERSELLKDGAGYYCEGTFRIRCEKIYGIHQVTLQIRDMVKNLINDLPSLADKDIYQEAMTCLKYDAGRASIIMVWNIAFSHLCEYILKHRKDDFNNRIPVRYPKKWSVSDLPVVEDYDDFGDEMSEREVLEVASSAGIITDTIFKVYKNRLDDRNSAAHPSTAHFSQAQAEGFIDSLVNNTIKLLKI
jgi:hypothetical protein